MNFVLTKRRLAQLLSIIAESAPNEFEYRSAIVSLYQTAFKSKKMRWSLLPPPIFSGEEFRFLLRFAATEKLVMKTNSGGADLARGYTSTDTDRLVLSFKGWEFLGRYDRPLLHTWGANVRDNIPTIIVSVLAALITGWTVYSFGPPPSILEGNLP